MGNARDAVNKEEVMAKKKGTSMKGCFGETGKAVSRKAKGAKLRKGKALKKR